jgi:transposase InsO family protein
MSKHLRRLGAPKLFYEAAKYHVSPRGGMKINGQRPLARPAKFPMASAPFVILMMDFAEWNKRNFLRAQGRFTRFSAGCYFGHGGDKSNIIPARKAGENISEWRIPYFGTPDIIFAGPGARFTGEIFGSFCAERRIRNLHTPSGRHASIGSAERRNGATERIIYEFLENQTVSRKFIKDTNAVAALLNLATNAQVSNSDGLTNGRRLYGRSPRLPLAQVDTLDFIDLPNPIEGDETIRYRRVGLIRQFRKNRPEQDHAKAHAKANKAAPRKCDESELFNGQTAYAWLQQEAKAPYAKQKRNGPGIIIGDWGNKLLLGYQNQILQVASESARATNEIFKLMGSDGQLQLHSTGGKVPLASNVDARTPVYLMRYQASMRNTKANLKAQDVSADSRETFVKEIGNP